LHFEVRILNLYLDTTTKENRLQLISGGRIIALHTFIADNNSDSQLLAEFDKFLKANNLHLDQIDTLIVNLGPGSFTGTRNGITLANSLKMAKPKLKLIGLSNPTDDQILSKHESSDVLQPIYLKEPSITQPKKK
jgi:tRNA A37 threonylcarbamoyladenosine modification protein TsaB